MICNFILTLFVRHPVQMNGETYCGSVVKNTDINKHHILCSEYLILIILNTKRLAVNCL